MNFICFDTEDDSKELLQAGKSGFDKQVTQIAAATAEGKRFYNRGNRKEFLDWLERQSEKYVYAHNLQYDLGNLFSKQLDVLDLVLVGGRVIKATWGNKIFVDSFNIWPMSAKKLGEAFGLEKLETSSMSTDKDYVFRDVEIIRQAMLFAWEFCNGLQVNNLPPTLGSLAVKVWQHFGGENCHDSTELSREAYYGGRVELFKQTNDSENVCWTDINSLYPSVMLKEFPGVLECWNKHDLPKYGVAKVTIKVPETEIPVLPYRNGEGRIYYPWGTFTGSWTVAEINAAVARGAKIVKVLDCMGTNEATRPYVDYVTKLYDARLGSKSDAEKLFFKLLLNNLYGRIGSAGKIGRSIWQTTENQFDGVPYGEKVLVEYQMPLSEETNWSHAAYVTAYGRLELLRFMETIGANRMIYCDTDSCIFDTTGNIPFPTGSKLGMMKIEQMCFSCNGHWTAKPPCCNHPDRKPVDFWKNCQTYAPKMYQAGKTFKAKGVPQRLAKEYIQTGKAEFDLPFKLRESIQFYDRANVKELSVWRRIQKENLQTYDRKKLVGNRFFPCKVNEV